MAPVSLAPPRPLRPSQPPTPEKFALLPVSLNVQRRRLQKRGWEPETMHNWLALTGWVPGMNLFLHPSPHLLSLKPNHPLTQAPTLPIHSKSKRTLKGVLTSSTLTAVHAFLQLKPLSPEAWNEYISQTHGEIHEQLHGGVRKELGGPGLVDAIQALGAEVMPERFLDARGSQL
ncbi:hypothetical protein K435DRAFT_876528 [Dendrothele bispora CBS 962.96]|uniref:Uncharacterized protein n=1 Tax=Dendrothele bispora (strain CBS 962.96) TaxID=1314807 RepID=A0A4S8KS57_DENBC|nr:hypothetical protein K435DRAFT_876528 [Dendrothele bispora CBS 962.96]